MGDDPIGYDFEDITKDEFNEYRIDLGYDTNDEEESQSIVSDDMPSRLLNATSKFDASMHVLTVVFDKRIDGLLMAALEENKCDDIIAMLSLNNEQIEELTYDVSGKATHLGLRDKNLLRQFRCFYTQRELGDDPIGYDFESITRDEFDKYRISPDRLATLDHESVSRSPSSASPSSSSRPTAPRDPLSDWQRGIKRDPNASLLLKGSELSLVPRLDHLVVESSVSIAETTLYPDGRNLRLDLLGGEKLPSTMKSRDDSVESVDGEKLPSNDMPALVPKLDHLDDESSVSTKDSSEDSEGSTPPELMLHSDNPFEGGTSPDSENQDTLPELVTRPADDSPNPRIHTHSDGDGSSSFVPGSRMTKEAWQMLTAAVKAGMQPGSQPTGRPPGSQPPFTPAANLHETSAHNLFQANFPGLLLGSEGDVDNTRNEMIADVDNTRNEMIAQDTSLKKVSLHDVMVINGKKYRLVKMAQTYSIFSHLSRNNGSLIDPGANGGVAVIMTQDQVWDPSVLNHNTDDDESWQKLGRTAGICLNLLDGEKLTPIIESGDDSADVPRDGETKQTDITILSKWENGEIMTEPLTVIRADDLYHDMITINKIPIVWYSKKQANVETHTYESHVQFRKRHTALLFHDVLEDMALIAMAFHCLPGMLIKVWKFLQPLTHFARRYAQST
jgi:hypothetical protein